MTREDFKIAFTFIFDWSIVTGFVITGAMLESGSVVMPSTAVMLFACITGFIQAAMKAKAVLEGRPAENIHDTVQALVAQMKNVQLVQAVTTKEIVNASKAPVTPTRVSGTDV